MEEEMDHNLVAYDRDQVFDAVEKGDLVMFENILKSGVNVNGVEVLNLKKKFTLLHLVVQNANEEMITMLLNYGANVNAKSSIDLTPLHIAAVMDNTRVNELLLNHGASIDSFSLKEGYTPLHIASEEGNFGVVKLYLSKGADINIATTMDNLTPLHCATKKKKEKIVSLLLQHGAQVDKEDKNGRTALNYAVEKGDLIMVEEVLKHGPDVDNLGNRKSLEIAMQNSGQNYTTIIDSLLNYGFHVRPEDAKNKVIFNGAIKKGYFQIVEYLLHNGADVNMLYSLNNIEYGYSSLINSRGPMHDMALPLVNFLLLDGRHKSLTPLHNAVKYKQEEIAKLLIKNNANVNYQYRETKVPIFYAIENDDLPMAKLLLNSGANVRDDFGLLQLAVEKGNIKIIEALYEWNIDINACDREGMTALHCSAIRNKPEITKWLVDKGANIDGHNKDGRTALHYAVERAHKEVIDILLEYNANVHCSLNSGRTLLHFSAGSGNVEITKLALNKGVDVNAKQMDGTTALHVATRIGEEEITKLLLEYGAQVNSKMDDGSTPLHLAAGQSYKKIIAILLKFGADIDSRDENGETALHIASRNGRIKVAEALVEFGSDLNITNKNDRTPLERAMDGLIALNRWQEAGEDSTYDNFEPEEDDDDIDNDDISIYGLVSSKLKRVLKLLQRHIIKMKTENIYVNENNLLLMSSSEDLKDYKNECEREIAWMRSEKINNSNISYYNVLTKSPNSLSKCLRNTNIVHALTAGEYLTKFPIYANDMKSQIEKGLERKKLIEQCNNVSHIVFSNMPELLLVCTDKIFSYLRETDLRNLIDACRNE